MILLTYWPWTKSSNLTGKYPHGARDAGRRPVLFLVVLQGSFTAGRTIFLRDQVRTCVLWPVVFLTRELDVKRRGNWFFIVFHWKVGPVRPFFLVIGPNSVSTSRAFFKSLMPLCDITYVLLDGPANQTLRLCEKQERKADSWQPWKSFKLLISKSAEWQYQDPRGSKVGYFSALYCFDSPRNLLYLIIMNKIH